MAISQSRSATTKLERLAIPRRFWVGLGLLAISWWASWLGPDRLGHHAFFPLWLGYILTVDALVAMRSGTSFVQRSRLGFAMLFVFSAPLWWGFELANLRLDNWHYALPHHYTWLAYHSEATVAFSTVLPAVLETAELMGTTSRLSGLRRFRPVLMSARVESICIVIGIGMIALAVALPRYCFPFLWLGPFFILDPVNSLRGYPSLLAQARRGIRTTAIALGCAGLVCGFFWEMWNSRAMPKWSYDVPFVGRPKLFEMPVLGYGGYIPFAFELYAAYHLLISLAPGRIARTLASPGFWAQPTGEGS